MPARSFSSVYSILRVSPVLSFCSSIHTLHAADNPDNIRSYRAYSDEPFEMVQELLEPVMETTVWSDRSKKRDDFASGAWSLTHDYSLRGLTAAQMAGGALPLISSVNEANNFDSYGVELVTAPMIDLEDARMKIQAVASAFKDHPTSTPVLNEDTALHVHVGRPDGTPFS